MEFYRCHYAYRQSYVQEFQFPTGWNSTFVYFDRNLLSLSVSIPNGMEFYLKALKKEKKWKKSFNSQRDGILLSYYADLYLKFGFQFPTGWNSTARILPFFYVERVKSIYFYALKWTKFKKAPITQCPKFQHFKILKATLSLSICVVSANVKI